MTYTILKNDHYAGFPLKVSPIFGKRRISKQVLFTDSCRYSGDAQVTEQVNKLFGFTTFPFLPHWNSVRYGWRWSEQKERIELLNYVYKNGKRTIELILFARLNTWLTLHLPIIYPKPIYGFALFPYFGGEAPAPHDITIEIETATGY